MFSWRIGNDGVEAILSLVLISFTFFTTFCH